MLENLLNLPPPPAPPNVPELAKPKLGDTLREANYDISTFMTTLFNSQDFYAPESIGSHIKNPTELVAAQAELATAVGEKWVEAAREVLDIQLKVRDDINRVFMDSWKLNQPVSEAKPVARTPSRTSKKAA